MVFASSSGRLPVAGAVEVADRDAARRPRPSRRAAARSRSGSSTSCSSAMSPTISSMMSSSVTRPCSAPYSSTTSAKCARRRRNSRICSSSGVQLRHEVGLHRHVHDVEALERRLAAVLPARSGAPRATGPWRGSRRRCSPARRGRSGCRVCGELIACARISAGRRLGVDHLDVAPVHHHLLDLALAEVERAEQAVAVGLLDRALGVAAARSRRRSPAGRRATCAFGSVSTPKRRSSEPHERAHRGHDRRQDRDGDADEPATRAAAASGLVMA